MLVDAPKRLVELQAEFVETPRNGIVPCLVFASTLNVTQFIPILERDLKTNCKCRHHRARGICCIPETWKGKYQIKHTPSLLLN